MNAIAVGLAAVAAGLLVPVRLRPARADHAVEVPFPDVDEEGWLRRWRVVWAGVAGFGTAGFFGGRVGPGVGLAAASIVWVAASRIEPRSVRARREALSRDLPHVVTLLGAALRAGIAPSVAIALVRRALPGHAADVLAPISARLALGADPGDVWSELAAHADLGPLGRTMSRAYRTGSPVVAAIDRLADELCRRSRAEVEDRARTVGVRAAVPLGVCLLPAFLLVGIVPLVAALAETIVG